MKELTVYLAGNRAGQLIQKDNGNLQFRYDAGYSGPLVSWALPIQAETHPHALCRAVFGGLLPEGDGREALARNLGVSAGNDYALLEEIGGDSGRRSSSTGRSGTATPTRRTSRCSTTRARQRSPRSTTWSARRCTRA